MSNRFKACIGISCVAHLMLYGMLLIKFSFQSKRFEFDQNMVTVIEVLPVSAIPNVKAKSTQKPQEIVPDAQKVEASKIIAQEEKQEEPQQQDQPATKALPVAKPQPPQQTKEEPAPKIEPEPKPKEEKKPKPEKKAEKKPEVKKEPEVKKDKSQKKPKEPEKKKSNNKDDLLETLNAIHKNIDKESKGNNPQSKKKSGDQTEFSNKEAKSNQYNADMPESITNKDIVRTKIQNNWNKPPSADNIPGLQIKFTIRLTPDGDLAEIQDMQCINAGNATAHIKKVIIDSMIRAIKQSIPFDELDKKQYESWQTLTIIFSPDA